MKTTLTLWFLLCASTQAKDCISAPCSTAVNYSYDLMGTPDNRPGTWGTSAVQTYKMTFRPPTGYRVRVIRVYGDFVAWVRGTPTSDPGDVYIGKAVGTLLGLSTTAPDTSSYADGGGASDSCFVYIQIASKGEAVRAPIDYDTSVGGLLEPDNVIAFKAATWLNSTGLAVHMEPSLVVVYRFEKAP